jgi:hypothetical protein
MQIEGEGQVLAYPLGPLCPLSMKQVPFRQGLAARELYKRNDWHFGLH